MHVKLWTGVELKLQHAEFHLHWMGRSLEPRGRTATDVALEASGAIIDTGWQRSFYAHLDAFLSATRSVAEIIKCCFGVDSSPKMTTWFDKLPPDEQDRRREFGKQFQAVYDHFCGLPLGTARHISEHRIGYAPVTVTISGLFGVTYTGGPANQIPILETRQIDIDDPSLAWMAKPHPVRPNWDDFNIAGQGLFPACQDYLNGAQVLMNEARRISRQVHGTNSLTAPA
ncbi:MAG: hypothetical protein WCC90_01370 [Methylocella sp.]